MAPKECKTLSKGYQKTVRWKQHADDHSTKRGPPHCLSVGKSGKNCTLENLEAAGGREGGGWTGQGWQGKVRVGELFSTL